MKANLRILAFNSTLPYLLQQGNNQRLKIQSYVSPVSSYYDPSTVEGMLMAAVEESLRLQQDVLIKIVDLDPQTVLDRSDFLPLWLLQYRKALTTMEDSLVRKIPKSLSANHMNRLRVMRAIAPVVCGLMDMTFDEAIGECREKYGSDYAYEEWDLSEFAASTISSDVNLKVQVGIKYVPFSSFSSQQSCNDVLY
ncbi:hypothetical protein GNI_003820 [Gregarina niphandrodes]|uniref:Uncharacterized protein n=1 Tax=Gregarina niphandrodes TaxID=110365 RepID=A0A023BDI3_GRENI|nr:hypothetical protein GNI_003820 [Gregarina niphandrodes]EZG88831.1 hypothetical protein GNI_003820 [Gregarina niphandrodes]|eukprot:XP_011128530.1 hypothetical protein GNI_003820 [Gregarina niphandrodes]